MAKKAAKKASKKRATKPAGPHSETYWAVQVGARPASKPYFMVQEGDWPEKPHRAQLFARRADAAAQCTEKYHKPVRVRVTAIA
jgi:hypothetical protein